VGLSGWRDPGFHQVSHFLLFCFYNIDTYTLYDIPIYNTMLTGTAGYASAYLAYPGAPPLLFSIGKTATHTEALLQQLASVGTQQHRGG
jgi:hypothetical protein